MIECTFMFDCTLETDNTAVPLPGQMTMTVSKSDVQTIASLAQLDVDGHSLEIYAKDLSGIMDMIQEMKQIDTDSIEPMPHPQDIELRLRTDEVTERSQRDELQAIAPRTADGLYLVPKVLE